MWISRGTSSALLAATIVFAAVGGGCNKDDKRSDRQAKARLDARNAPGDSTTATTHTGWWCQEHGVPEDICSICMSEANAKKKFKDNGDWCKLHDRAESQCFKCDPTRYKKFEDMYVAKYDKKPEPPPADEFKK